jgi:signal transduction histidine kinase
VKLVTEAPIPVDLSRWPSSVLHVNASGDVMASNGKLDAEFGVPLHGRSMESLLDDSSLSKWARLATHADPSREIWELIFDCGDRLLEPAPFTIIPAPDGGWWLVEHPVSPRLLWLSREVAEMGAELATSRRALFIEQARLAEALKEVERSNRALDEFAHVVSHDLKAPLRGISEHAEVVADATRAMTDEERAKRLERINELTVRMRAMIDAALAYARVGRSTRRIEHIDTSSLLREIVRYLDPPPGITIRVAEDLPPLDAEVVPFEQVFRNLLSNAINYGRQEDGRIEVAGRDAGRCVEFVVSDNGPGIPESQRENIWRLFQTSRPGEGTGLGLALVRRIVESAHGSVSVTSSPTGGAEFHVAWPKQAERR